MWFEAREQKSVRRYRRPVSVEIRRFRRYGYSRRDHPGSPLLLKYYSAHPEAGYSFYRLRRFPIGLAKADFHRHPTGQRRFIPLLNQSQDVSLGRAITAVQPRDSD